MIYVCSSGSHVLLYVIYNICYDLSLPFCLFYYEQCITYFMNNMRFNGTVY